MIRIQRRDPDLLAGLQLDLRRRPQRQRPEQLLQMLVRLASSLEDAAGEVQTVRVPLQPQEELPGGVGAVYEGGFEGLETPEVVGVDVREEAC